MRVFGFTIGHQVGAYRREAGCEENVKQITAAKYMVNTEKENIKAAVVNPITQVIGVVCWISQRKKSVYVLWRGSTERKIDFGILNWSTSAVCFGPPSETTE